MTARKLKGSVTPAVSLVTLSKALGASLTSRKLIWIIALVCSFLVGKDSVNKLSALALRVEKILQSFELVAEKLGYPHSPTNYQPLEDSSLLPPLPDYIDPPKANPVRKRV